jgi:hypothetical protein
LSSSFFTKSLTLLTLKISNTKSLTPFKISIIDFLTFWLKNTRTFTGKIHRKIVRKICNFLIFFFENFAQSENTLWENDIFFSKIFDNFSQFWSVLACYYRRFTSLHEQNLFTSV